MGPWADGPRLCPWMLACLVSMTLSSVPPSSRALSLAPPLPAASRASFSFARRSWPCRASVSGVSRRPRASSQPPPPRSHQRTREARRGDGGGHEAAQHHRALVPLHPHTPRAHLRPRRPLSAHPSGYPPRQARAKSALSLGEAESAGPPDPHTTHSPAALTRRRWSIDTPSSAAPPRRPATEPSSPPPRLSRRCAIRLPPSVSRHPRPAIIRAPPPAALEASSLRAASRAHAGLDTDCTHCVSCLLLGTVRPRHAREWTCFRAWLRAEPRRCSRGGGGWLKAEQTMAAPEWKCFDATHA